MKKSTLKYYLFLSLWFLAFSGLAQMPHITHSWKFKVGDSTLFADNEFNDTNWDSIRVGVQWQDQGIFHDGIGWYRKAIQLPKSQRRSIEKYGLAVSLGAIDDADETFFNGTKIGQTGNMVQNDNTSYFLHRNYDIPTHLIDWKNKNTLAIRVQNYTGGGGIYTGNISLENRKPDTFFDFSPLLTHEEGNYTVMLRFNDVKSIFKGKIVCRIHSRFDHAEIGLQEKKIKITIGPKTEIALPIGKFAEGDIYLQYSIQFEDYSHVLDGVLFPKSNSFDNFQWLGEKYQYTIEPTSAEKLAMNISPETPVKVTGDTYPCTWANDDAIYMSAGDPDYPWGKNGHGCHFEKIEGTPLSPKVERVNLMEGFLGGGGSGAKPSGLIAVNGVLYLAVQNILGGKPPRWGKRSQHASDVQIFASSDNGKTWLPNINMAKEPMFPGCLFGGSAFINCGKNNLGAPDSFVYAVSSDQWDNGTELRLGRVHKDSILIASSWEWVAKINERMQPTWVRNLQDSAPILSLNRSIGSPDMIYIPELKKHLLFTWKLKNDFNALTGTELFVFEADKPWGPFQFVHHEKNWEEERFTPYCPRVPLKWIEIKGDEITAWMLFSGSWTQNHIYYHPNFRKFKMKINR